MIFQKKPKKNSGTLRGFTLIEGLVFLFMFAIVSVVFLQTYAQSSQLIIESKKRLGAIAVANQKMEIIRSLDYDAIGTKRWNGSAWVYGIPPGDLLEDETVNSAATRYTVHTFVQYKDDPYDGVLGGGGTPDNIPTDYKRVEVKVTWGAGGANQTVELFGTFAPEGVETAGNGGVLSINILNAAGNGVPNATVRIQNSTASVDLTTETDASGNIYLPGAPAGNQNYILTVSKSGYYGTVTYPPYPTSTFVPVDIHASVVAAVLNLKAIIMDQDADMTLKSEDPLGTTVPNVSFALEGGRIKGHEPDTNPAVPVYDLDVTTSTNASGEKSYTSQSYGSYTVTPTEPSGYTFYKMTPEGTTPNSFDVSPGVDLTPKMLFLNEGMGSVFVKVVNSTDSNPIMGATVALSSAALSYDVEVTTDKFGYAYFPTAEPPLVAADYTLEVSATGFQNDSSTVTVGGALVEKNMQLTPQ